MPSIRLVSCLLLLVAPGAAFAGIHTWDVREVFSNADGSVQFIELYEANGTANETGVGNGTLSAGPGGSNSFMFGQGAVAAPTTNKSYLIATQAFADLDGAPVPDVIIPIANVPFFDPAGDEVCFGGFDCLAFGAVPTDGVTSLSDVGGVPTPGPNSPTNYAGDTASVDVSLDGDWNLTITEVSNTCAEPLGPMEVVPITISQETTLVDIDADSPDITEIGGVISGSNLSIGLETRDAPGIEIFAPAQTVLTIAPGATMLSGDVTWEFYEPLDCTGTQTWTGVKSGAGVQDDLTGSWTVTVVEQTDSCGPIDPTPLMIPIDLLQEGALVDGTSPVDFGQTRLIGRVAGKTVNIGLSIRESSGDFTLYDLDVNAFTINAGHDQFTGTATWASYSELTCSGVDSWAAVPAPEPAGALPAAVSLAALLGLRRARRVRRA